MDTKPLERFATQSRRELITAVEAQAAAVLAAGSVARSERGQAVKRLEAEIEQLGQKHVIDKVAYTWFNRIIALRYMDAHGYTSAGVVSPAQGQTHGQPEILADAKRGHLDDEVVTSTRIRDAVRGLLDGTRRSTDAEGEAYGLLLTEYCRFWNKSMPFMFEREGDYTELLVPSGLLTDGAILSRAREVMTEDVCKDVEVIGWLYQFYIAERKDEVFASFKKNKKAGAEEIPAATQLFTPHWIVRYLVENSVGRLWMLNHPDSRLVDQMDYYIAPIDEQTEFLKISGPEELTVIDPACGSGHMLTFAFDLLYAIYEEEGYAPSEIPSLILTHNLHGTEIDPRAGSLAAFALTMKARDKDRRFLGREVEPKVRLIAPISFRQDELDFLITKSGDRFAEEAFWNQFQDADTLGSLIRPDNDMAKDLSGVLSTLHDELLYGQTIENAHHVMRQAVALSHKYAVVVANPPYMGGKQMNPLLSQFMKDKYPKVKQDLYGAFVVRGIELAYGNGLLAIVIGDTWMSIKSFEALRLRLLDGHAFNSFVHMRDVSNHPDIFGANAAFVLSMAGSRSMHAPFIRLTRLGSDRKEKDLRAAIAERTTKSGFYHASGEDFAAIPGSPIVYWLSEKMRASFSRFPALESRSRSAIGMITGRNAVYVRQWWEVDSDRTASDSVSRPMAAASGRRWFPYAKGGEFRRWAGNIDSVVDWQNDGVRLQTTLAPGGGRVWAHNFNLDRIFRSGIAWTVVTSGDQSFRLVPAGSLFDAAAGMCQSDTDDLHLAVLNSSIASVFLATMNPTLNLHPGYLGAVPIPPLEDTGRIRDITASAIRTSTVDWDLSEMSWNFECNPIVELV